MNDPLDFSDKVALVTGAAAGMGLATAQAFAEAGVRRDREARSHRPGGQARGDRVGGAVALQSGSELRGGSCPHRGRRNDGAVMAPR